MAAGVLTTKYMTLRLSTALAHWSFGGRRFIPFIEILSGDEPTMDEFD